jgi:hypothetical protein
MLSVSSYKQEYVDACRARVKAQLAAYKHLRQTASAQAGKDVAALDEAFESFDAVFFDNMVMTLDEYFVHRARTMELKDGNPLNEVRVLCSSMMLNDGILAVDKTIKLKPGTSILGYQAGDEIKLDESGFTRLAEAFFTEIERKYP